MPEFMGSGSPDQVGQNTGKSPIAHGSDYGSTVKGGEVALVPIWDYDFSMRIIALSTLRKFWESSPSYADSIEPGTAWYRETLKADWSTPNEVKAQFSSASILRDGRVVFNIAGNKYRVVVWINYAYRVVYIRFVGTHEQYDAIDAQTI
nr:type II toxin-antitoxin system HigB family toxin [Wenzhouxiangella sp. XN24]